MQAKPQNWEMKVLLEQSKLDEEKGETDSEMILMVMIDKRQCSFCSKVRRHFSLRSSDK